MSYATVTTFLSGNSANGVIRILTRNPTPKSAEEWEPKQFSLASEQMIECYKADLTAQKSSSAVTTVGKGDTLESYIGDVKGTVSILLSNDKVLTAPGCMLTQVWEGHVDSIKTTIYAGLDKAKRLDLLDRYALFNLVGKPAYICAGMSAPPAVEVPAAAAAAAAAEPATVPAFATVRQPMTGPPSIGIMYTLPDNGESVKKFLERARGNTANVFYNPKVDTIPGLHDDIRHVIADMASSFKNGIRVQILIECPGNNSDAFYETIRDATKTVPHLRPYISLYRVTPGAAIPPRAGYIVETPMQFSSTTEMDDYARAAHMRFTDLTAEDDDNALAIAKRDIAAMIRMWNDGRRAGNLFRVKNDDQLDDVCYLANSLTADCADMRSHIEFCALAPTR